MPSFKGYTGLKSLSFLELNTHILPRLMPLLLHWRPPCHTMSSLSGGSPEDSKLYWAECTLPQLIALALQVTQGKSLGPTVLARVKHKRSLGLLAGQHIERLGSKERHTNPF